MKRVLLIGHVRDKDKSSGGIVYLAGLCQLLRSIYPEIEIDSLYCAEAKSMAAKPFWQLAALCKSLASSRPSKALYFRSRELELNVSAALEKHHYDLICISQAEMFWTLDLIPRGIPVVHISQNVEHLLYQQLTERIGRFPLLRYVLKRDARKYQEFEIGGLRACQGVICISADDEQLFRSRVSELNSMTIYPMFSYPFADREPRRDQAIRLGFVANLHWWPNREAMNWFRRHIVPALPKGMTLHCFGRGSESLGKTLPVMGHGFIEDISQVWRSFDVMIAPMFAGAGINVKVAEAIYNRIPVMCTSHALRGLPVRRDESIAVLDTPEEWIAALNGDRIQRLSLTSGTHENSNLFCFENGRRHLQNFLGTILQKQPVCSTR